MRLMKGEMRADTKNRLFGVKQPVDCLLCSLENQQGLIVVKSPGCK